MQVGTGDIDDGCVQLCVQLAYKSGKCATHSTLVPSRITRARLLAVRLCCEINCTAQSNVAIEWRTAWIILV